MKLAIAVAVGVVWAGMAMKAYPAPDDSVYSGWGPPPGSVPAKELDFEETKDGVILHYRNMETNRWENPKDERIVIKTSKGEVVAMFHRTQNNLCSPECPDMLEIIETPPGTVAVPPGIELAEHADIDIKIIEFVGM